MKLCNENKIIPVLGVEMYVCNDVRNKTSTRGDREKYRHITLLAANQIGYHNLINLITDAELEYKYFSPRVDIGVLKQYSDGVICLSGCCNGLIGKSSNPLETFLSLKSIYGDRFFVEIMRVGAEGENELNAMLINMAEQYNVHVVATNDVHYYQKKDGPYHERLLQLNTHSDQLKFPSYEFYYKSQEEMYELFADYPYAVDNIDRVLSMIEKIPSPVSIPIPQFNLIDDPLGIEFNASNIPPDRLEIEFLKHICITQLSQIQLYGDKQEYIDQINRELDIIDLMNQAGYILLTRRITNHVKSIRGLQGAGRGSCAASLVCYLTGITLVDPIRIKNEEDVELMFSRFLNKGRCVQYDFDLKLPGYSIQDWKQHA